MGNSSFKPSGYSVDRADYIYVPSPKPSYVNTGYRCSDCQFKNGSLNNSVRKYVNVCDICGKMFR